MPTQEPWVSADDVVKHLGIARQMVYRWFESESLPAQRIWRLWKFQLSEVDGRTEAGGAAEGMNDEGGER